MANEMSRREFGRTLGVLGVGGTLPAFGTHGMPAASFGGGPRKSSAAPFDIESLRLDTPGCTNVAHFNNAGSSLPPRQVLDAAIEHLQLEAQIGGYEAADLAHDKVGSVYDAVAALIGAKPNEIAVIENATRHGTWPSTRSPSRPGIAFLRQRRSTPATSSPIFRLRSEQGVVVEVVPNDEYGQLSVSALKR